MIYFLLSDLYFLFMGVLQVKVLFVYGGNGKSMPFIKEQKDSLIKSGVVVEDFIILGKGFLGYISNLKLLRARILAGKFDVVHAHYGLSGLLAVLQNLVPIVTTFHGSDVNLRRNWFFSFLTSRLSDFNIYVNHDMQKRLFNYKNCKVIPCGVDTKVFYPIEKIVAKKMLGLNTDVKYILFTSSFNNFVKNYPLARDALNLINDNVSLIELKDKSRDEVNILLNACELLLMTSFSEGSPQIVKEALATNTPVVSTNVGDVSSLFSHVDNCFLVDFNPSDVAGKIIKVIASGSESNGRESILKIDVDIVANSIVSIYKSLL